MYLVDIPGREIVADVQEEEALPRRWGQGLETTYRRRSNEGFDLLVRQSPWEGAEEARINRGSRAGLTASFTRDLRLKPFEAERTSEPQGPPMLPWRTVPGPSYNW